MNSAYLNQLQYSRITDRNIYPETDALYNPLRKVLLRPQEVAVNRPYLNPAAAQSRVTRDFAYLTERQVRGMREHTLIPVDQPLYPTYDFDKVKNSRFMVVDAHEQVVGAPITVEEMQRIRAQGLKEERVVYDFGQRNVIVEQVLPPKTKIIEEHRIIEQQPTVLEQPTVMRQTKVIKQELKTSYRPPAINEKEYVDPKDKDGSKKYKYNLYSMLDQQVNGGGCGCPANEFIASRNQPQSISWLN